MLAAHAGRQPMPLAGTAVVGLSGKPHPSEPIDEALITQALRERPATVSDAGAARWAAELMSLGRISD
jgi:hypothetical protein